MIILDLVQGSPEWHQARASRFTASEAPAMMGASKYQTRSDLLKQKATGITPDVSEHQQRIFDNGHEAEAKARPLAERIIGEELFPATATPDDQALNLLASFDGITMMEDVCWEHKLWNKSLAASITADELEPHYFWQLEQQLLVSGAERCLFMCSDGTEENMAWMWYYPVDGRREELLAGWNQFADDLAGYQPEAPKAEVVAAQQADLPALVVDLVGEVRSSNLGPAKQIILARIESVNTDLTTDQDFADAEAAVKFFDKGEKELEATKKQALAKTASIDEMFRTIDELKEAMRTKRLSLNKLVKSRKEEIKTSIILKAKQELAEHISFIEQHMGGYHLPTVAADFAGAIKGKRTVTSLQSAADDELARAKIEANRFAESMTDNINLLTKDSTGYEFLFSDREQLVLLDAGHLKAEIKSRISDHKEQERQRQEQERERIRQEEKAKAQAKADAAARGETQQRSVEARQEATQEAPRFTPPAQKTQKSVTIPKSEYQQLQADSAVLAALRAAGVNNWQGYEVAMEMLDQAA
ncbi:lambda-exonuclease family protein [Neptuniibacter halophilus]|uniref:lambda-exonuclease family protein n=1 Tax=Neptuniibacter halophilus TaxID=651666 RepID=UPI0025730D30|nr:YqaJ viral recombinase family protein [Neptuniibacter halophilus]